MFVLRVVRQTDHVAAECLGLAEQHHGVGLGVCPAHALGDLFVERDRLEEHGRAVEDDLFALGADIAEPDRLLHPVAVRGDDHPVKFRIGGGPALQSPDPERRRGRTGRSGSDGPVYVQFGNLDPYGRSGSGARQLHIGVDPVVGILAEADEIVPDKGVGHADEHHVARDAAVVPPVEGHRRDGVRGAGVVDLHGQKVAFGLEAARHLDLKGCESAFMGADLLAVEVDPAAVADGPEMEELPPAGLLGGVEPPGIPHRAFVVFQLGHLAVPVRGNVEPQAVVERIFVEIGLSLRPAVEVDLVFAALIVEIDDGVPLSVERLHVASVNVGDQLLGCDVGRREQQQSK